MEIVIALDTYEDIFSDFDIRGFDERSFSVDFLDELRFRMRKPLNDERLSIVLLVPAAGREASEETLILERMRSFFDGRSLEYRRRAIKSRLTSFLYVVMGLVFLAAGTLLSRWLSIPVLMENFLLIPAWFFVWSGLELFIRGREEIIAKKDYYSRLAEASTVFMNRENY